MMASNQNQDWSQLNGDVLGCVMNKLIDDDYIRSGAVCTSWKSVFDLGVDERKKRPRSFPLLLIPPTMTFEETETRNRNGIQQTYSLLYDLCTKSKCDFKVPLESNQYCRGSSFGWLIMLVEIAVNKFSVHLRNPFFSRNQIITLPSLDNLINLEPEKLSYSTYYIYKAVLSANPCFASHDNLMVMAIVGPKSVLAISMPGMATWYPIEWEHWDEFSDVIYSDRTQKFLAIREDGAVVSIDIRVGEEENSQFLLPKLTLVALPLENEELNILRFLVESSSGDLLQVINIPMSHFEVFKLDPSKDEWIRIYSLKDDSLFLGQSASMSLSAPCLAQEKANCIYYTAETSNIIIPRAYHSHENGIFNLEDNTTRSHYEIERELTTYFPPIWLETTS